MIHDHCAQNWPVELMLVFKPFCLSPNTDHLGLCLDSQDKNRPTFTSLCNSICYCLCTTVQPTAILNNNSVQNVNVLIELCVNTIKYSVGVVNLLLTLKHYVNRQWHVQLRLDMMIYQMLIYLMNDVKVWGYTVNQSEAQMIEGPVERRHLSGSWFLWLVPSENDAHSHQGHIYFLCEIMITYSIQIFLLKGKPICGSTKLPHQTRGV